MFYSKAWKRYLFLFLLLLVGAGVSVPIYYIYQQTKTILLQETQNNAINSAHTIAAFLSSDIERYRPLSEATELEEGSELHQSYVQYSSLMRTIKERNDATFIYTSKYLDDQTSAFVLDGEEPGSMLFSPFGSHDSMDGQELYTFQQGELSVTDLMDDPEWGVYLSAYAPIIDGRDQSVVGLVGVDYSQDHFSHLTRKVAWILNISFAIFTIVLTVGLYTAILTIHQRSGLDDLTGLGNKRAFNRSLHLELGDARKRNQHFVLCMLDIDYFKSINDTYGHPVGDVVLKNIGRILLNVSEKNRSCYRIGGDEFALILPATTLSMAEQIKTDLHKQLAGLEILSLKSEKISASIGMAEWIPGITAETLINLADKDLYEQKRIRTRLAHH
nr:GGDEF domain-containing protein [uncultured Sphaerochaeta sp.]